MNYMNAQQYLDHRNTRLWNEVSEHFNIALVPSPDETYVLYTIRNEATLNLPSGPPCIDSFTHELLQKQSQTNLAKRVAPAPSLRTSTYIPNLTIDNHKQDA